MAKRVSQVPDRTVRAGPPSATRRGGVLLATVIASTGGVLFGYGTGVLSGAQLAIRREFALGPWEQGALVAAALLGAAVAAPSSGALADRLGRKKVILLLALVYAVGTLSTAFAGSSPALLVGRAVVGLALGASSSVVPLYISEISPPGRRGLLVTLNQLMITVGILASFVVDYTLSGSGNWRLMLGLAVLPALVLGVGACFVQESPRWLAARGRHAEAAVAAASFTMPPPPPLASGPHDGSGASPARPSPPGRASRRFLRMTVAMAFAVQLTGLNTAIYYAPTILTAGGSGITSSVLGSVLVGIVNLLMAVVSMALLDRTGRRPLFLGGLCVMGVTSLGISASSATGHQGGALTVFLLCVFIAAGAVGPAPIFWVYISEIFPQEIRGRAMGWATAAHWSADTLVALTFVSLVHYLTFSGAFLLYAGVTAVSLAVFSRAMVETRGRSLEEIARETGQGQS
ncbi:MFS transporter [Streptomyces griseocarneus]|nr:MFS transporter [Streptomyces griseocarneus]